MTLIIGFANQEIAAQHSVARQWNEVLLEAIRKDFARPTVHARNLFHTSIAMYDSWAVFDPTADTYFLGNTVHQYPCPYNPMITPTDVQAAREEAMSYACYRLLKHRFEDSPGAAISIPLMDSLMIELGYDTAFVDQNYSSGSYAALGNHLAAQLISYGLQDNANEQNDYENVYYNPTNPTLIPIVAGNPSIIDENRWQPLTLNVFIDQGGNVYPISTPEFLGAEWGSVNPFALTPDVLDIYTDNNGDDYWVYHDPGAPPLLDTGNVDLMGELYQWGFTLVSIWSSHLDSSSSVMWDISPASIGNLPAYPTQFSDYDQFYDLYEGGDPSLGHDVNPATGMPYAPQMVPRSDYARVLAEFWADGPDSETPPGHWFTLLNYVSDHPNFEKRFEGQGPILPDLEWDVKSYFAMAGTMHDAAISAWGIKGWYDYLRPISALRFMADLGQSSYDTLPNYHPAGIPLHDGYVELIDTLDPFVQFIADTTGMDTMWVDSVNYTLEYVIDSTYINLGKIKVNAWRGPDYITDPDTSVAGVGWILAEHWWPYQRPTFVTPPFAGYISGHSTFSSAAAKVMTLLTGDPFFPGGIGEFHAPQDSFLVFEDGPSVDVTLQWATYKDAADQCSLSRIWGGIHPPADDIPGRYIGCDLGNACFSRAVEYYNGSSIITNIDEAGTTISVYPNPVVDHLQIQSSNAEIESVEILDIQGKMLLTVFPNSYSKLIDCTDLPAGTHLMRLMIGGVRSHHTIVKN